MTAAIATPAASWTAEVETQVVTVLTGKLDPLTGREKLVRVTTRTIFLSRGHLGMAFKVGRGAGGKPVITDDREAATGRAGLVLSGPTPGEAFCKPGPVRKLTATGWVAEVSRLIGAERAREIVAGL